MRARQLIEAETPRTLLKKWGPAARWRLIEKTMRQATSQMWARHGYLHYPLDAPWPFENRRTAIAIREYSGNSFEKATAYDQTPLRQDRDRRGADYNAAEIVANYTEFIVNRTKHYWDRAYPAAEEEKGRVSDLGNFVKVSPPVFMCSPTGKFVYLSGVKWEWTRARAIGATPWFEDDSTAAMAAALCFPELRKPDLYGN